MSTDSSPLPYATDQDPQVISNAPDLPSIRFRADDFTGFRRALLRPLPGEQAISDWRPAPGDLGLQVLEWWAYLGDVLTFYNERYANESYLGTATQVGSTANLVALLGYQPTPGIAATGVVAALRPAGQPRGKLAIPAGMTLSSTASPDLPSQTFEVDLAKTFTGQSSVPVSLEAGTKLRRYADKSPRSVLLAGRVSGVTAGDRLVLVDSGFTGQNDYWSQVTVAAVTPVTDPATGGVNTRVRFADGGWGPTSSPGGGVAAPPARLRATRYRLLRPTATAAIINPAALAAPHRPPRREQPLGVSGSVVQTVHLSAAVPAISPGDLVLFDQGAGRVSALAFVTATSEALWTIRFPGTSGTSGGAKPPDLVIAHTVLDIATADSDVLLAASTANALGSIAVRYGFKDLGTIIGVPPATLRSLGGKVAAAYTPPDEGTTAILQDVNGTGVPVMVTAAGPGKVTVSATGSPPSAILPSKPLAVPLRLMLNLVPVTRGTTVPGEVLGSGNAAYASQSFTLAKSPLTYIRTTSGGIKSTLTVTVDNIAWHEVASFYSQAATARVFVVTRSPDQTVTTVTFGNGVNGARLPSGTGNVVASYRYGSGAASPPAGQLTTINQPQPNLASIQNPVQMSGGADPESPTAVRTSAPASVITFGRAISASDYEQIASQAPGVSRATAYLAFDQAEQRTLVTVYVDGGQAGAEKAAATLRAADPNRPVVPTAATQINLTLSCRLVVAPGRQADAVVAAAKAAISSSPGGLFSPSRMGIGQRLYRSALDAALLVPGVTAVNELVVKGAGMDLGEVLDPGPGRYFDLPRRSMQIKAVSG
jgi:phage-related baseplate assembly protein